MIRFRKLRVGDLDEVYQDDELRPLITGKPKGRRFAAVVDEEEQILGGVSGYLKDKAAYIQCVILKDMKQKDVYQDGLIRSLIHFLDLDGAEYLFVRREKDEALYRKIGFQPIRAEIRKQSAEIPDALQKGDILWLNLKDFFEESSQQGC